MHNLFLALGKQTKMYKEKEKKWHFPFLYPNLIEAVGAYTMLLLFVLREAKKTMAPYKK